MTTDPRVILDGREPPTHVVLVVDDDHAITEAVVSILEEEPDISAVGADSGEEALRLATESPPDLVLLDLMMPGMDGFALGEELRARPSTANVPLVAMTALAATLRPDQRTRLAGWQAMIAKPFSVDHLIQTVRRCLDDKGVASTAG